jgi:hypothetical protein
MMQGSALRRGRTPIESSKGVAALKPLSYSGTPPGLGRATLPNGDRRRPAEGR